MTELARKIFAGDKYATEASGIVIDEVTPDKVECSVVLKPHHRNAKGAVMGGLFFTLADFAFAIAANCDLLPSVDKGETELLWVSSSSTINFLSQPKGNRLRAITTRIRQGRSQALFQISIFDDFDRLTALATTSASKIQP